MSSRHCSVLRRVFVIMGYKPARYLTSPLGKDISLACGILGSFFISGVLHELSLYLGTIELPLDRRLPSMRFFLLQGIGLVAEQVFTRITGRKVGGWAGRLWLVALLGYPGADLTKAWYVTHTNKRRKLANPVTAGSEEGSWTTSQHRILGSGGGGVHR